MLGQVLWFNEAKGYGILRGAQGEDVFFTYASIQCSGLRTVSEGQVVDYEAADDSGGLTAIFVIPCAPVLALDIPAARDEEDRALVSLETQDAFVA